MIFKNIWRKGGILQINISPSNIFQNMHLKSSGKTTDKGMQENVKMHGSKVCHGKFLDPFWG